MAQICIHSLLQLLLLLAGTSLGDPIEVGALAAALVEPRQPGKRPLALMAAKSWSGHAEPGAGEGQYGSSSSSPRCRCMQGGQVSRIRCASLCSAVCWWSTAHCWQEQMVKPRGSFRTQPLWLLFHWPSAELRVLAILSACRHGRLGPRPGSPGARSAPAHHAPASHQPLCHRSAWSVCLTFPALPANC